MDLYLGSLYDFELESGRLSWESDPEYRRSLDAFHRSYDELWEQWDHPSSERLWSRAMELSDAGARCAFAHGFRLALWLALQARP